MAALFVLSEDVTNANEHLDLLRRETGEEIAPY